ncbi:MAG: hypothetical protein AB7P33_17935 [Dehalococcoidia bacterium]
MRINFNLLALAGGAAIIGPFWPAYPIGGSPSTPPDSAATSRRAGLKAQQKYSIREAEQLLRHNRTAG